MKVTEVMPKIPYLFSHHQSILESEMKQYHQNIAWVLKNVSKIEEALQKCCVLCDEKSLHVNGETDDDYCAYFDLKACTNHQCGWSKFYLYLPIKENDEELSDENEEFESSRFLSKTETDYIKNLIEENRVDEFARTIEFKEID